MRNKKILIVDFDLEMMHFYARFLEKKGFEVSTSSNGFDALNKALVLQPALIILDFMNADQAGLKLIKQLRGSTLLEKVGIVLYTQNYDYWKNHDELVLLVDKLIEKPVIPTTLEAVINETLVDDQSTPANEKKLEFGAFSIDIEGYSVHKGSLIIDMTKREFELILLLASRPGKLFTRQEIIEQLWGKTASSTDRILDVYIAKLRKKLGKEIVHTLKGVGYSLGKIKHSNA